MLIIMIILIILAVIIAKIAFKKEKDTIFVLCLTGSVLIGIASSRQINWLFNKKMQKNCLYRQCRI